MVFLEDSMVSLFIPALSILLVYYVFKKLRYENLPGPLSLPLLGTVYKHGLTPTADKLMDLSRVYGAIYRIYIGPQRILILNNYESVRESLMRPSEFSHRGLKNKYTWIQTRTENMHGLFCKDFDASLTKERNTCAGILRKLGMGKTVLEDKILEEINAVETIFKEKSYTNLRDVIHTSIGNVTVYILLNKHYSHGDPIMRSILQKSDRTASNLVATAFIDGFPLLRFIPPFKGIIEEFISSSDGLLHFMKKETKRLFDGFDRDQTDSFVESYFENGYNERRQTVDIDIEALPYVLGDLLAGGMHTSATAIRWTILLMANNQEIQEKLYNEIIGNTEDSEPVRHSDRDLLPYLEAVMWEIQRFCNVIPFIMHQSCDKITEFRGYEIPANSMILLNVYACHMNEKTWGDPLVFRPERFINEDGEFVKHPHVIPFSLGKRACPGEILARQELYLFTGNLVKRFHFSPPDGIERLDEEPVKESIWAPKPFDVNIVAR